MHKIVIGRYGMVSVVRCEGESGLFINEEVVNEAKALARTRGKERALEYLIMFEEAYPHLTKVVTNALEAIVGM